MKQKNDLLNEVKDKLSNRYYLEQRDQELVNDCVDELLVAINYSQCCKSDSELLTSFAEYLKERDILTTKKENIPVRVDLFLKRG